MTVNRQDSGQVLTTPPKSYPNIPITGKGASRSHSPSLGSRSRVPFQSTIFTSISVHALGVHVSVRSKSPRYKCFAIYSQSCDEISIVQLETNLSNSYWNYTYSKEGDQEEKSLKARILMKGIGNRLD